MLELKTFRGRQYEHLVVKHPRSSGNGYAYAVYTKSKRNAKAAARDCGEMKNGTTDAMWNRLWQKAK